MWEYCGIHDSSIENAMNETLGTKDRVRKRSARAFIDSSSEHRSGNIVVYCTGEKSRRNGYSGSRRCFQLKEDHDR